MLPLLVVAAKQTADVAGVARAPCVLQQQRIEQGGAVRSSELQLPGQPHPDQTGAFRVTRPMPLDEVERV